MVITGSASEGPEMKHATSVTRTGSETMKERAKDPDDPLELVIVRDMWLNGFDSPSLHTMYVDKPMRGAGLMQAIARVNRTFRDKPGGLVVDYIGIAESFRAALADYTDCDRARQEVGAPLEEALALLEENDEICRELLYGCPWQEALDSGSDRAKLEAIHGCDGPSARRHGYGYAGPFPRTYPDRHTKLHAGYLARQRR